MIHFVSPLLQSQVVIPEQQVPGLIEALKKHGALIPKVILPG